MFVPVGVIAQAAGVAAYPYLARLFAEGRSRDMADTVDRAMRWVILLSLAATAMLATLAVPTITVLFERYQFTADDTVATASALVVYAFAIPIWGALAVLTRAFYARRQMWTPVIIGTVFAIAAIPVYALAQDRFGIEGVAAASVLALGGFSITLGVLWYGEPDHAGRVRPLLAAAFRALPLAVVGGIAALATSWAIGEVLPDGFVGALAQVAAGLAVFMAVVVGAGTALLGVAGPGPAPPPVVEPELTAATAPAADRQLGG